MSQTIHRISRRAFVQSGTLLLLGRSATTVRADDPPASPNVRVGLVTDLHYADKPPRGTRHYRDTLPKLAEATAKLTAARPDFVVELGDFIDAADAVETELGYLRKVHEAFAAVPCAKHYVLGNHCVDMLTKAEFLAGVGRKESFYSFDVGGFHFVVLDACFRADGEPYGRKNATWTDANVPPAELDWLRADLKATTKPVVVFAHQRLDDAGPHAVRNAADVRRVLESTGAVQVVLQGHSHGNDHQEIGGIHYATLVAMVEGRGPDSNGYGTLDLAADGTIRLSGFRRQATYAWPPIAGEPRS